MPPLPPPVRALAPFALLAAASVGWAQLEAFPPAPEAPVDELLGDEPTISARRAPLGGDSAARAARLQEAVGHGELFFVQGTAGDAGASKVVYLVPQYHRSSSTPLGWTSVGRAIAEVQAHIEALVLTLEATEGVRCVGTEGSWDDPIPYAFEHRRLAYLLEDLRRERALVAAALAGEGRDEQDALDALDIVLHAALKERAAILDGVGSAQSRLDDRPGGSLDRFGLEDRDLNIEAVALRRELDAVDRELATLDTSTVSAFQSKLGEIWLSEIELYEASTLRPLDEARLALDKTRMALRRSGAEYPSRVVGRYLAVVTRVDDEAIRSDEVRGMTVHYRSVDAELQDGGGEGTQGRRLSRVERRQKRRLDKRRAKLQRRYDEVTIKRREHLAAERVLERINRPEHDACVMVYGAGHREGLERALVEVGRTTGMGPVGIVVVQPFE